VNGELWGGPTSLPWGIVFPTGGNVPRHPSQLYEAVLEGLVLMALLVWMFWKTRARYQPGKLVGTFILGYGLVRFGLEFIREPDAHLVDFAQRTGLHMGQWLSLPMILGGIYLIATAKKREARCSRSRPMSPTPLEIELAARIAAEGPIPVADYMAAANAHYYATRDPFGVDGDSPRRRRSARCSAS
jgi:hypothetical protein